MMKSTLIFLLSFIWLLVSAQPTDTLRQHPFRQYVPQDELDKFNLRQMKINQHGIYALSGWAVGNVIYGSIAASLTHDEARYFHATNAIWGGVNLAIAVPGVISSYSKTRAMNMSFGKTILQQHGQEKLYLINGALDFA